MKNIQEIPVSDDISVVLIYQLSTSGLFL